MNITETMRAAENQIRAGITDIRTQVSNHLKRMQSVLGFLNQADGVFQTNVPETFTGVIASKAAPTAGKPAKPKKTQTPTKKKTFYGYKKQAPAKRRTHAMGLRTAPRDWKPILTEAKNIVNNSSEPINNETLFSTLRTLFPNLKRSERDVFQVTVRKFLPREGYVYSGSGPRNKVWMKPAALQQNFENTSV